MPASPDCMPVPSRGPGTQSQFSEESLRRITEHRVEFLNTELHHPASAPRFIEVGSNASPRVGKREGEAKKENDLQQRPQQLAADGGDSCSSQQSKDKLGIVGSRGNLNESESQFATSSGHWVDNAQSKTQQSQAQDRLSFHGEDTLECITNVDEEEEFGFSPVVEFAAPENQQSGRKRPSTAKQSKFPQGVLEEFSQGTSQGERRPAVTAHSKFEARKESSSTSAADHAPAATGANTRSNDSSSLRSGEVVVEQIHQQLSGAAGVDCTIPEVRQTGSDIKGGRGGAHFRKSSPVAASHASVPSEDRRVRIRLLDGPMAITGRREPTEDASCTKVARPSRPSAGKDRHSKVNTAKGPRDRRVRLSVPTAVQFYDVQDRLGYDQPSKAVEWLIKNAKTAIDELGTLPTSGSHLPSSVVSDVTHSSPYSGASSHGLVNPAATGSSCPISGSFPSGLGGALGDHVGNQMTYFMDPTIQQISSFGHSPTHMRDVGGASGLSQGHSSNVASHGPLGGLGFCFQNEQADLSRGCPGVSIGGGGKLVEFHGAPLARSESRVKARERARERVKEKCGGRDDGKSSSDGCSPSMQSPSSQHQNLIPGSFPTQSSLQGLVHSHAHNLLRPGLQQSSLSGVFNATLSGILQSSQPGTLHNFIMQNPSLHSSLADQSLRQSFQSSLSNTMQQQQPGQLMPSFESSSAIAHGPIDRDSGFSSEHGALSFASAACPSRASSDPNPSISQPLALTNSSHCLPGFGVPPSVPMQIGPDFQMESTSELMHIRPGLSSGSFGTDFRHQPESTRHSYMTDQQRAIHGYSRTPSQLIVPNYSGTSTGGGSTGQDDSPKDTAADVASLYYSTSAPNTRLRNLQVPSIVSMPMDRMSFSSGDGNVSWDYPSGLQLQAMSPGTTSSPPYQSSSSQIQMPARIHGLEDDEFDDEKLKGASLSSSPPLHS